MSGREASTAREWTLMEPNRASVARRVSRAPHVNCRKDSVTPEQWAEGNEHQTGGEVKETT